MTCAVQRDVPGELVGDNTTYMAQMAMLQPSINWPVSYGGFELDFLNIGDPSASVYYQDQQQAKALLNIPLSELSIVQAPCAYSNPQYPREKPWWESDLATSVYNTLKERERHIHRIEYRSPQLLKRQFVVDFLLVVGDQLMVCPGTRLLAMSLMDQFMDRHNIQEYKLKLVAITCLLVAAKLEDLDDRLPTLDALLHAAQSGTEPGIYSRSELQTMEIYLLKFFSWCVSFPTPAHFSDYFLSQCPEWASDMSRNRFFDSSVLLHESCQNRRLYLEKYTEYFVELATRDYTLLQYPPSMLAAMSLCAARVCLGAQLPWPVELESVTGYTVQLISNGVDTLLRTHQSDPFAMDYM